MPNRGQALITLTRNRYRQRHGQSGNYRELALDIIAATNTDEKITGLYLAALNNRDNRVTKSRGEVFSRYLGIELDEIETTNCGGHTANKSHFNQYTALQSVANTEKQNGN